MSTEGTFYFKISTPFLNGIFSWFIKYAKAKDNALDEQSASIITIFPFSFKAFKIFY